MNKTKGRERTDGERVESRPALQPPSGMGYLRDGDINENHKELLRA